MAVLRIFFFLLFLCCISRTQNCASNKLPKGSVLGCSVKGSTVPFDSAKNETIPTETICVVETEEGVIRATCNGTDLEIIKDIEDSKSHIRRKRGWWRRTVRSVGNFFKGVGKVAACVITLFSCLWGGRPGPRDRTPPGMTCTPPLIPVTAKPYEIYAYATWSEPTAHDETDGIIKPRRKSGRPPGSYFPEFDTEITYEAKDRSGNRAACSITVRVEIVRCDPPKQIDNGYFQCSPVTEFLNGGICRFGCYEGFDLSGGASLIKCQENGQWSESQPVCQAWECPYLHNLSGAGNPVCTNGLNFRSICVYNCASGFDMPPKVSKALVCDKTKSWRKFGEPKCVDVEAPTFSVCPSIIITGTDTGYNSTEVSWKEPEVRDNSKNGKAFPKTDKFPGIRLTTGTYTIQYGAEDQAGNTAVNDCKFKVIVREIRCAKLYPTPFMQIDCPSGYRSGARCSISCEPGKILHGSDDIECNKSPGGLFGVWNWRGDQQSVCKHGRACVSLDPPKNGAVACDNWEGGQYCQIQCRKGTEMSSVSLKKLYVCSTDGDWSTPPPSIRTCREVRRQNVQHTIGIAAIYYFDGDCTNPITQQQIASNFIAAVTNSLFQPEACPDATDCNPQNVQITCGESDRKRRSTLDDDTQTNVLELTMSIPITIVENNIMFSRAIYKELIDGFRNILLRNKYEIFGNISITEKQFKGSGLEIHCPEGAVQSEQSLSCVDCPEGTYYLSDSGSTNCEACQKGFYQEKVAQKSCTRCPEGTTTQRVGAESETECQEACPSGSFSKDGLLPCSPCEQGDFQSSFGQMACQTCRGSKTTLTFGSESTSDCEEFDIEFILEENSDINVTLLENVRVKDFTLAFWLKSDSINTSESKVDSSLTVTLSTKEEKKFWTWNRLGKVMRKDNMETDTNFTLPDSRWHYLMLYSDPACNVVVTIDGVPLPLNPSDGICAEFVFKHDFYFISLMSFNKIMNIEKTTGESLSQFNVWHGKRDTDHKQRCFSEQVGDVFSWKRFEDSNISGAYMRIPSQCDDFDNCVSSPCLHGSCTDAIGSFTCSCEKGFVGTQCDVNIDDCEINICMNNATCVDGFAAYTCLCPTKFTGQYCEIEMVDGGLSVWGNWSECSSTCGEGKMKRKRLCNSPSPDNGGMLCVGELFDFQNCNNSDCPVCPPIVSPLNGSLDCANDTGNISCNVSCDEGFEFDIEPLPVYYCGPETFHEWNFQTDENPERRLPKCVAISLPEKLKVHYSAHYRDLYCPSDELEEYAREQIDLTVKSMLSNVPCLLKQSCSLSYVDVIDCDGKGRQKRTTDTAGFSLEISNNPTEDDKNETLNDLEIAFQFIQDAAENGELTVEILDDKFELDGNLTDISGEVLCRPGETRVRFYCVPCGKGSYLYTDYCKPCPIGTYQDVEGQSSCNSCPPDKSTVGILSTSINDCTVLKEDDTFKEGLEVIGIVVGCTCALIVVLVVVLVYRIYKSKKNKISFTGDTDLAFSSPGARIRHYGDLGPNKLKFKPKALREELDSIFGASTDKQISDTEKAGSVKEEHSSSYSKHLETEAAF